LFGPAQRIAGAIVGEVSVLPPGVDPAEPCAEVLLYRHAEEPADGEIIWGGPTLRRSCGQVLAVR
jgi:hypothetical protein